MWQFGLRLYKERRAHFIFIRAHFKLKQSEGDSQGNHILSLFLSFGLNVLESSKNTSSHKEHCECGLKLRSK